MSSAAVLVAMWVLTLILSPLNFGLHIVETLESKHLRPDVGPGRPVNGPAGADVEPKIFLPGRPRERDGAGNPQHSTGVTHQTDFNVKNSPSLYRVGENAESVLRKLGTHAAEDAYSCGDGWCVCKGRHADCSDQYITYIPKLPSAISSCNFSRNLLDPGRKTNFFQNISHVAWLDLSVGAIENVTPGQLQYFRNLTYLDLSRNRFVCEGLALVFKIPTLEVLKLSDVTLWCFVADLDLLDTQDPIPSLRELDLSYRNYRLNLSLILPFTGLRRLDMHGRGQRCLNFDCSVSTFDAFLKMDNLTILDVSEQQVLSCDDFGSIIQAPSLRELTVRQGTDCNVFAYSKPFQQYKTNLTRLDFSHNGLRAGPILHFPKMLEYLDLSSNNILLFDDFGLVFLKVINLSDNSLNRFCDWDDGCGRYGPSLPSLEILDLSNNDMTITLKRSYWENCFPQLKILKLYSNKLYFDLDIMSSVSPFSSFRQMETLDISAQRHSGYPMYISNCTFQNGHVKYLNLSQDRIFFNDQDFVHPDSFKGCPALVSLDADNNIFKGINESRFLRMFGQLKHLTKLSLRSTGLTYITAGMFRNFSSLETLQLGHNSLLRLPDAAVDSLPKLIVLDLSFNKITTLPESVFSLQTLRRLQHVDLSENPFICSCEVLWFQHWLFTRPSVFEGSSSDYQCGNLPDLPLLSFSMTEQACLLNQQTSKFIIATVSLIFLGLSSLAFVYRYRWHLRLVLHEVFRGNDDRARHLRQHRFKYDVFVCYDHEDSPWVREHLMPNLEDGMGLKLCLHYRDFIPGTPILKNIQDSVDASKKMLMLFSRQFAQSEWCQFELQLCLTHAMDTQDILIVVLLEDIPSRELTSSMMAVMKTTTYIEWANEADARDSFWRRMGLAMHEVMPYA